MASEQEVTKASPADVAADMDHHRSTYGNFFSLLKWSMAGVAVIVVLLFIIYN